MWSYGGMKSQDVKKSIFACFFGKTTAYWKIFKILFRKDSLHYWKIGMLCSTFVKFGRREIGEILRCLPHKQNNKSAPRSPDLSAGWIAPKICCGQPQTVYSECSRFHSNPKSVHFRRSYIRTREHRQSALQSESNIRMKPILRSE